MMKQKFWKMVMASLLITGMPFVAACGDDDDDEGNNGQNSQERPWTRPTKWEYTYDSHGNWISYNQEYMILIDGPDGPVHNGSLSRTIEYY